MSGIISGAPDARTFASVLGQATWLMTMSQSHRNLPIRYVEERLSPAILLKQFRLFSKDKQPVAFLTWASVSESIKQRIESGGESLALEEWRSGENIIVVDCISPLVPSEEFIRSFLTSVEALKYQNVEDSHEF